jgi:hypothetical protein
MNIKPLLSVALVVCAAGCTSLTESQVHCTSLSRQEEELVHSDLNHVLVSKGLTRSPHENPYAMGEWFGPLRKGSVNVSVSAHTNSYEMVVYVGHFGLGRGRANKRLTEAIVSCVHGNAPDARVSVQVQTDYCLLWWPFE